MFLHPPIINKLKNKMLHTLEIIGIILLIGLTIIGLLIAFKQIQKYWRKQFPKTKK